MASKKRVTKPCEDCGTLLVDVVLTRKLCYDCAKKRQREYQRNYKRAKPRTEKKPESPIINTNKKYCKGCIYWHGAYRDYEMCNYIFDVGHRRPCPPGNDCTEKVKGKRLRAKKFEGVG